MPAGLVAVTEGSGKNLESWQWVVGSNTVERQVIAMGEQHLAGYTITAAMSTATAASHLVQIMAGASLKVRIRRIEIYQRTLATTAQYMSLGVLRLSTAGTGGAGLSAVTLDTADAVAGMSPMQLPTVKGTENGQIVAGSMYMMQTAGVSSMQPSPQLVWDFDRPRSKPLIIAAGAANGICIKTNTAVAGGLVDITIWADESNF